MPTIQRLPNASEKIDFFSPFHRTQSKVQTCIGSFALMCNIIITVKLSKSKTCPLIRKVVRTCSIGRRLTEAAGLILGWTLGCFHLNLAKDQHWPRVVKCKVWTLLWMWLPEQYGIVVKCLLFQMREPEGPIPNRVKPDKLVLVTTSPGMRTRSGICNWVGYCSTVPMAWYLSQAALWGSPRVPVTRDEISASNLLGFDECQILLYYLPVTVV